MINLEEHKIFVESLNMEVVPLSIAIKAVEEVSDEGTMKYFNELKRSMEFLGSKKKAIFIGQAVSVPGTAMRNTLINVKREKLLELPVAEEMQMGLAIGLSMESYIPICIYPRWNFLLLAMNQLINHLNN